MSTETPPTEAPPQTALIIRDDLNMRVAFTKAANELKEAALEAGALIGKCDNATDQIAAVSAQTELQRIISLAEKARKAAKDPVLSFGKKIDATHEAFTVELKAEALRIARLVGDFQQLEQAKARAAEQARNEKLLEIEREKAAQIAQATSHEQIDAIQEHFTRQAESIPVHAPARVEGQRVASDWEITITDIHKLYRMHANCVELKPRLSEIKSLLKMGVNVQGIIAKPIVKAGVTVGKEKPAIDI